MPSRVTFSMMHQEWECGTNWPLTSKRLQLVASTDTLYNLTTFKEPSQHFLVKSKSFKSHLTISKTIRDDTGTYYCGVLTLNKCDFGQETFLLIKGTMCLHFKSFYLFIYLFFLSLKLTTKLITGSTFSFPRYKPDQWLCHPSLRVPDITVGRLYDYQLFSSLCSVCTRTY